MGRAPRRATGVNDPANKMQAKLRGCAVRHSKVLVKLLWWRPASSSPSARCTDGYSLRPAAPHLATSPKSGRKRKLTADQQGDLQAMAAIRETGSAKLAAAAYKKETGVDLCKQTAWRLLTESGHAYRTYRKVSMLSHAHRLRRLDFAAGHLKYLWSKVMWTDSKFFTLNTSCKNVGHYVLSSAPPSLLAVPKRGPSLHVYMGVTMFGLTRLVVVSGGSTPNKTYVKSIDRKTGRKNFYSGVCAAEYQERVLPVFAADGFELFSRKHSRAWLLQQDGAAIHQTAASIGLASKLAPGGLLAPWPALSPDLSIIENVWALMSQKLSRMDVCTTAAQLEASLNEIRSSITLDVLHGLFDSIPRRMQDCIRLEGAPVRF